MPPTNKGKGKVRESKRSPSRNTTPSSRISASPALSAPPPAGYLDNDTSKLLVPATSQYVDVLERVGTGGTIPEQRSLQSLVEHLKNLSQAAEARGDACNAGMRELAQRRKEVHEDRRSQDQGDRYSEERPKMKREVEEDDDDEVRAAKGSKVKKRKDRGVVKEERPLTHGAHSMSRQDGTSSKAEGARSNQKRSGKARGASPSSKKSKNTATGSMSSLSPPSLSPTAAGEQGSAAGSPSAESQDSHQPEPAPAIPQYQVFGPDPLRFDDPTIYHIRDVTPNMTDEERKEIYCVEQFPSSDLSHMMAGTPPDKDFSTAKPSNQVSANTFATYIEPYVRPLTEEDIAFLKEKGDRSTPFLMPRRGKKHYSDIWAEEDGSMNIDSNNQEKLPLNQGRGNIDQVTDETTDTDQVSVGPLLGRLHSLLRFEHRVPPEENSTSAPAGGESSANGMLNGDSNAMDLDQVNGNGETETKPIPSATTFTDTSPNGFKVPAAKLEHAQLDERLKAELRYVGFLGEEDNPDYDAHYDDDIAERLRLLQAELKKQMIINGARKTRLLEIARERMAYQEYSTIRDDLDSQVQQAYLKRTRTLGKSKKGSQAKHRPGGAGGGSHPVNNAGVSRPGIGDVARTLMDRRKRWADCIGPIFKDSKTSVPPNDESVFDPALMEEYEKAELENWDEEQE